jgi:toxin FitB
MESRFLVDTNILIYSFSQVIPEKVQDIITPIFLNSFNISVINKIEFLGWRELNNREFIQAISFISNAQVLPLNDLVIDETIKLRRDVNIKLPDAIIAATCFVNNLILLTRNTKDFSNIVDLELLNPFEEQ